MKIRGLTLENVRKFGGQRVAIDAIGDGITVICEANEFGKSTFFDAIHAVIFEKHSASGRSVKSLQPHAGGAVRIALEVELEGARYSLEKRFLAQKGASVTDRARGVVIARDGEAEDWIARHIGMAEGGPAGLLWVRQGVLGLEPADAKPAEKDRLATARRDLLSSVAGEIEQVTGGRTMDRILRRCQADLDLLATGARLSPKGPWKEAVEAVRALEEEHATLARHCAELSGALAERREAEAELQRLDDPAARARREADLRAAQEAAQAAESHAQKIASAESAASLAGLRRDAALRARDGFAEAEAEALAAQRAAAEAASATQARQAALTAARSAETAARAALEASEARTRALRAEQAQAARAGQRARARADLARLEALLAQVRGFAEQGRDARARLKANPVTPAVLSELEQAAAEEARLRGLAAAQSVRLRVAYHGAARLTQDGVEIAGDEPLVIADGAEIAVPGIATLHFDLPRSADDGDARAALEAAQTRAAEALARCGVDRLAEAQAAAAQRQEDANAARLAEEMLRSLAPEGVEALEQAQAEAREVIRDTPEAEHRPAEAVAADLETAETAEADGRGRLQAAAAAVSDARALLAAAETAAEAARERQARAAAAAGAPEERAARRAALAAAAEAAEAEAQRQAEALAALRAAAPDATTATANLTRAQAAVDNSRKRREHLAERRAALSAQIEARADAGIEESRGEAREQLAAQQARAARCEAEVQALVRLRDALSAARDGAREAYFEPVQEELRPLLRILHEDAGLDWESDSITPGALRRGGESEAFETLSGGTQEQIAILTRLAFARLFARRGQHLPIILDDALVYSDDDRIVKMFTALNRVALEQQIIVFSCRQLAFAGLGGDRPRVRMEAAA